jgi:hypothetical protein
MYTCIHICVSVCLGRSRSNQSHPSSIHHPSIHLQWCPKRLKRVPTSFSALPAVNASSANRSAESYAQATHNTTYLPYLGLYLQYTRFLIAIAVPAMSRRIQSSCNPLRLLHQELPTGLRIPIYPYAHIPTYPHTHIPTYPHTHIPTYPHPAVVRTVHIYIHICTARSGWSCSCVDP